MPENNLIIESGGSTITFYELDWDKEMQVEIENMHSEYNSVFLDKNQLISLRNHVDNALKKIEHEMDQSK